MKRLLFCLVLGALLGSCDPYYDDQIAALGPEAPGVRKGPLHRPGQPCLLCHDGAVGSPPQFSVAGTVFVDANGLVPAVDAAVLLSGADGVDYSAKTNAAGNFYVSPAQYTPVNPMRVVVKYANSTATMHAHVGRDGSCAGCHTDPAGPASAGHVYAVGAPP